MDNRSVPLTSRWLLVTSSVGLACLLVAVLARFGPHLMWLLSEQRALAKDLQPIAIRPLVAPEVSTECALCRLGSVSLAVPSGMIEHLEAKGGKSPGVLFQDAKRKIFVGLPVDNTVALEGYRREL